MSTETDVVCRCDCAYLGAQLAGTPIRCERCRGLVDEVAADRMAAVYAESARRLREWESNNPLPRTPTGQPTPTADEGTGHE